MAKKKSKNGGKKTSDNNEDGGMKEVVVVLKLDLHCEGCSSKVEKCVRSFEGIDKVKCDTEGNKLTVAGTVDPAKIREMVEEKTKKKVELVSPSKPKAKGKGNDNENDGQHKIDKPAEDGKNQKNKNNSNNGSNKNKDANKGQKPKDKSGDEKKSKEAPVTTAVMKAHLHCDGCIEKIYKVVTKTKGYREIMFDRAKDLVTVKGSMDMKALADSIKKQLKRDVEIVPAKKEGGDNQKKEKGNSGGFGAGQITGEVGGMLEGQKMDFLRPGVLPYPFQQPFPNAHPYMNPNPYMNPHPYMNQNPHPYHYAGGPGYGLDRVYAPQMFSDENPNACAIV